jgi:hypothetical protein
MNDWGLSVGDTPLVTPEVERKSRSDARHLLVRALRLLNDMPEWGRR